MSFKITLESLLGGCSDDSLDDGIRIDADLVPLSGGGGVVKPAVYEGGKYQEDSRWASASDDKPTKVIVIDNIPSQANRLEDALQRHRASSGVPEFVLDLSCLPHLPSHLPRQLSSLHFPHRNADAYLRDSKLGDSDFIKTDLGKSIFGATAQSCGPLMAWFPQALIYGFWQSHLGKKRHNAKHARAWVSEIVGWSPASTETKSFGLKGDMLNLNTDETVSSNANDRTEWAIGRDAGIEGGKADKLSEMGHGQVPFMDQEAPASAVSFARITQRATVSFAQLRRITLGGRYRPEADQAARALLVALGLHAHSLAFGRGFALRSGAELRPSGIRCLWLGGESDEDCELGNVNVTQQLLDAARAHAELSGVPLDGWGQKPTVLAPRENLAKAIRSTWPEFVD